MAKKVCIALVNFGGHFDTIECLESILKSDYEDFQVVVVDNSIGDSSLKAIREWVNGTESRKIETQYPDFVFPLSKKPLRFQLFLEDDFEKKSIAPETDILLVKANANHGFAGGNNIAINYFIKNSSFDFIWLLNNDTVISPNALSSLVSFSRKSPDKMGLVGSKLFLYHSKGKLQAVGGRYNKWLGIVKEIGYGEDDNGQWDVDFHFDYTVGASMFVKRKFIEEVGPLSEDYFLYFEELDWALRGKQKSWTLGFCCQSIVYHKLGASINKNQSLGKSQISDFYSIRNRLLITRKYFPYALITVYCAFLKFVINRIKLGQFDRIAMMLGIIATPSKHFSKKIISNSVIERDKSN